MNASLRAILTAVAGFAAVLLAIWGVDHGIVQPAFVDLERAQALEDGARAQAAVRSELRQLDNILGNWAAWDDAYAFADNRNPAFIQSNLGDWRVLEKNSRLNLCFIFNRDGQVLYGGGYNSNLGGTVLPAVFAGESPAIWTALQPGLEEEQARTGLLLTEYGLLLLAARPILTTQGMGPARGLLVFGRFLDKPLLRALAEQTQVAFELLPATDTRLAPAERGYPTTLRANEPALRPGPGGALFVYELLPDWAGQPAALLQTPVRQAISMTARHTSRALMGALGLAALALLLGQAVWANRVRGGGTGNTATAWSIATLAVLIGLTLTVSLGWELRRRGLATPDNLWVSLGGGGITLLLAWYLFALILQRQRAERLVAARTAELQASEERYRIVALMTGQMIYDYDCPTGRIQWTGAIAALTGQDAETFAAVDIDAWAARIHPEDRTQALDRLRQTMAAGASYEVEYRFARGDGAYCWIADHGAFLLDERGMAIRMLGTMKDVTERKQVAAALEGREAQLRTLIDAMPDVVCFKDGAGRWVEANAFAVRLFGLEGVAYRGKTDAELTEYSPSCREAFQRCEETDELAWQRGESSRSDERIPQPDGTDHIFDVIKIPRFDDQGRRRSLVVVGRDVTERHRAEAALRASEQRFRAMIEHAPDGIVLFDGTIRYASPAVERLLGYTPEEVTALDSEQLTHPEDLPSLLSLLSDLLGQPGRAVTTQYRFRHKDGSWRWLESTISNLLAEPSVGALVINFRDITDRRHAEARQRLAAAVFDAAREAIFVADAESGILAVNPAFTTLTGYAEATVRGRSPRLLWAERQPEAYFADLERTAARDGVWQGEFWARRQDGDRRATLASLCVVRDATGRITHYVGIATDITAQKAAEQRIEHLAYYDALTDLPNRALLAQRAELALALAARHHGSLAVLFLDLDRFKEINDALGHAEGDALLAQVAARLQALVRAEDTVCRLGGDEFVLLLPEATQEGALRVADKVLAALRQPFVVAGHLLNATASVGIALYPHDGPDFAELLKNADVALYRAKHAGRNVRVFYDRAMNAATLARMVLETELRQALGAGQLRAYYQPKVRLNDGALVGAEALMRWQHPERGLIPPGQFIPVAEASDLIVALGDWMLVEVCRQLAAWRRQGGLSLTIAVNLAARHFRQPGLADRMRGLLEAYNLPAQALELELTESTLLDINADTIETLRQLERLGIGLALDDFGTGYSSLSYLKRLPLTALKIEQGFVRDLETNPDDRVIAATIVALGHHLELVVVAEGVETENQRRFLLEQGCDMAQGYLFGHPLPAEAFAATWLDRSPA
ncbi:MAG: EAL domain-containing protein [Candidatus Competibacteraceae bacterium]